MALTFFSGFETGDFGEWSSTTGSPAIDEAIPYTGDYCTRCNTTGGAAITYVDSGGSDEQASMRFQVDTAPNSDCAVMGNTVGTYCYIDLTTDRYLKLYDSNDNLIGTSSTQLVLETQYRISFAGDGELNGTAKVFINGSEEISGLTVGDFAIAKIDGLYGLIDSVTADIYIDDVVQGDVTDLSDLGDIRVLRASPNVAGQYAEFDTVSGYENCDEVPTDGATTIVDDSGVGAMHRECYNLQDATTIGVGAGDTVKAVNVWINYADAGETDVGIIVRDDGTDYTTVTGTVGKAYTWKNKLYDTNAPRASAWTPAIFTAFQSGGYNEGTKDMYMSTVMVMVAYIPVGVTDYPISLSPGLTVSATVAYKATWDRGMSPGLTATITIARALAYDRATAPGLTVSATIAKAFGRLITSTANLTVSSTVARYMTYTRAMTSNLTASATVVKGWGRKIVATANLAISTTIAMSKGFVRAVISNLIASTTVDRAVAYNRTTTLGLMMSATIARIITYHISTQSALSVAVSIIRSLGRTITTSSGLTVAVTVVKSWGRAIATSTGLTISTTIVRSVAYNKVVSAGLNIVTSIIATLSGVTNYPIALVTNLSVSATVNRIVAYNRATQTALSVVVSILKSWGRAISTSTSLAVSTTIDRAVTYKRAVSTGLTVSVSIVASYITGLIRTFYYYLKGST